MFITPEALFENARLYFMSERFLEAFDLIRECFDEQDVDDETIMAYLKGNTGVSINENDVTFGDEFIDEDYKEEINDILTPYFNVLSHDGKLYSVSDMVLFDFSNYVNTSEFTNLLERLEGKFSFTENFSYSKAMTESGIVQFRCNDAFFIKEGKVAFFKEFRKANIEGITIVSDDINHVVDNFKVAF